MADESITRKDFLACAGVGLAFGTLSFPVKQSSAESYQTGMGFVGGVGGLGKTQAQTGIKRSGMTQTQNDGIFLDDIISPTALSSAGQRESSRLAQRVSVYFEYPKQWRISGRDEAIDVRDLATLDGAFLVAIALEGPNADKDVSEIPAKVIIDAVYAKEGKFGSYGAPEDVKVVSDKTEDSGKKTGNKRILDIQFSAFTPTMISVPKKSVVVVEKVGRDAFIMVATANKSRFKSAETNLRNIAASFQVSANK
uniref:PsbP C-terminal domain-containing protein n=1 Tax=Fibrocapsa japonica TaxID=94617 RepID=A0A7S2V1N5_9STRA